ncbi:MAG: Tol-Pal system subunit TolQ, partial [Rhodospirillales bacterium]
MEQSAIDTAALAGSVANLNFSVWSLFMRADWIVKAVMILLVLASVWCWAIIFEKVMGLKRLNEGADEFEAVFWSGGSLDQLYDRIGA